jgi:hypothetical protein
MKKRNYLLLTAVPMLSALAFTASASAQTPPQTQTTNSPAHTYSHPSKMMGKMGINSGGHMGMNNTKDKATILGMTETDLTAQLANGKTLDALITEKGLTKESFQEKMRALHDTEMKAKLSADVASGKITQAKADQLIVDHTKREADMKATVAKALGITVAELDAYKASGTSIDTIITQKGLDKATVMKALGKDHMGKMAHNNETRKQHKENNGGLFTMLKNKLN